MPDGRIPDAELEVLAQEVIVDFMVGQDVSDRPIPSPGLEFLSEEEVREMMGG